MNLTAILHAVLLGLTVALSHPREPSNELSLPAARRSRLTDRLNTLFTHNSSDTPPTVTYNANWAGAVLTGAGYRSATGTIQVPAIRLPPGADSNVLHAVSAWVGIDGEYACPNAILQVGVDMYMNHSVPAYWAWLEWFPNRSTYLTDFVIRPGDSITMTVMATSRSSATFSITNHATGQKDSASLADQAPLLCGFNAEWIVEDFWGSDGVPLVDFGSVAFTGALFETDTGISGGVEGAKMDGVKEKAGGPAVIECEKLGGSELTCEYKKGASP
ncbi:peptidase A4 family-domain-containing protein [Parachaetomium inaequale]|uniref:Peptidase A4 family-domain-containing protein n=1 Tax=Parachaetomium inaequale TaxID=2588326 RepID=A0AAN6PDT4_9PEZI|nr:peptidase A4 family-domain-containing protein [Parachaetomium inaequale]